MHHKGAQLVVTNAPIRFCRLGSGAPICTTAHAGSAPG